jgi:hypothetical protein
MADAKTRLSKQLGYQVSVSRQCAQPLFWGWPRAFRGATPTSCPTTLAMGVVKSDCTISATTLPRARNHTGLDCESIVFGCDKFWSPLPNRMSGLPRGEAATFRIRSGHGMAEAAA